jgi:hypothetical protein
MIHIGSKFLHIHLNVDGITQCVRSRCLFVDFPKMQFENYNAAVDLLYLFY